ncbi:uncharacterized protein [Palaemon carinicauda]|uniref:uncharacterized protein isoform X2 n=1 Tax=Palaemon carinicauda TaxID=392227 RepID=UPI0035B5F4CC
MLLPGCIVVEEITEKNASFDFMEFLAFCWDKEFAIDIECLDGTVNKFKVSSNQILGTSSKIGNVNSTIELELESRTWQRLSISSHKDITLNVCNSTLTLSECKIKEVRIKNGFFTKVCPTGMPFLWINANDGVKVPFPGGGEDHHFAILSTKTVNPVFRIHDKVINLKIDSGGLHEFTVKTEEVNGMFNLSLRINSAVITRLFNEFPAIVNITEKRRETFLLLQSVTQKSNGTTDDSHNHCLFTVFPLGVAFLVANIISCLQFCHYRRALRNIQNQKKTSQHGERLLTAANEITTSPSEVFPAGSLPGQNPQITDGQFQSSFPEPRLALSQHLYLRPHVLKKEMSFDEEIYTEMHTAETSSIDDGSRHEHQMVDEFLDSDY